jgi:signal transduction histidine kinase
VLREAAAAAGERATGRSVAVTTRLGGALDAHVDPGRLRQVLDNLLDNATRSSAPGQSVLVAARALPGGGVEAAVVDQGPGIAAEDLPHAFDRGYLWARYRGTRVVGSGLGLAIVRALCDAMGVAIRADSGDGGGVEAAVVDQGPGIAAEDLPHAFDRGYLWARYRGTRVVGSGLGLAIVRALCDAMGVAIRADSGDGGGLAFRLTLPAARGAPAGALSPARGAGSPTSPRP